MPFLHCKSSIQTNKIFTLWYSLICPMQLIIATCTRFISLVHSFLQMKINLRNYQRRQQDLILMQVGNSLQNQDCYLPNPVTASLPSPFYWGWAWWCSHEYQHQTSGGFSLVVPQKEAGLPSSCVLNHSRPKAASGHEVGHDGEVGMGPVSLGQLPLMHVCAPVLWCR